MIGASFAVSCSLSPSQVNTGFSVKGADDGAMKTVLTFAKLVTLSGLLQLNSMTEPVSCSSFTSKDFDCIFYALHTVAVSIDTTCPRG